MGGTTHKLRPSPYLLQVTSRTLFFPVWNYSLHTFHSERTPDSHNLTAANPSQDHLDRARSICHYLAGTKNFTLVYDGDSQKGIYAYTDSDWAADKIKHQSITGYFFKIANGIFSWCTHAQKTVALSSTEAKYMAMSDCS